MRHPWRKTRLIGPLTVDLGVPCPPTDLGPSPAFRSQATSLVPPFGVRPDLSGFQIEVDSISQTGPHFAIAAFNPTTDGYVSMALSPSNIICCDFSGTVTSLDERIEITISK